MQALSTSAKNAINAVNATEPAYKNAVAARESAFAPLSKLITRVLNALKATDTTFEVDDSAKHWFVPIPGTTKLSRLDENLDAAALALTLNELKEINIAASKISVQGDRYSEGAAKLINR